MFYYQDEWRNTAKPVNNDQLSEVMGSWSDISMRTIPQAWERQAQAVGSVFPSVWMRRLRHSPAHCGSHVAVAALPAEKPGPASLSLGGSAGAVGCYWTVWLFSLRAKQSYNPHSAVHPAYFLGNLPLFMRNISLRGDSQQQPSGSGLRYNAFPGLITAWRQRLCWRRRFHIGSTEEKTPPPVCFELLVSVFAL